jgi:hypothetical protein
VADRWRHDVAGPAVLSVGESLAFAPQRDVHAHGQKGRAPGAENFFDLVGNTL